ncbi:hypothetical protein DPMN_156533 [Dreissena polymorpha]|uniref:Secreted protein n=1 Tax=Dreissena polymorpha TaxID=45954 RepID=A0A9D4FQW6_DREPO|nr:hypothetical protein DPMN_156533 [Dreissena polymorpha]
MVVAIVCVLSGLSVSSNLALYRATTAGRKQPLDLLGIRRAIVKVFLAGGQQRANRGRPKSHSTALHRQILDTFRLHRKNHYATQSKQRRYALCSKHWNTSCTKCNVGLHRKCFIEFHTI